MITRIGTLDKVEVWFSSESTPGDEKWFQGPDDLTHRLSRQPDLNWTTPIAAGNMFKTLIENMLTGMAAFQMPIKV